MPKIDSINCHKIINSRGDWTIETHVILDDGSVGVQTIPDGASKGEHEALYVDVARAIDIVEHPISDLLHGENPFNQKTIDDMMISMDGTDNKKHLGGNSILSVSLAVAKASAASKDIELYQYLADLYGTKLTSNPKFPTPLFNVINGGKHATNGLSFQEFMVIPSPEITVDRALDIGVDIYHILKTLLEAEGYDTGVGDEGGFAPENLNVEKALDLIKRAAGSKYKIGEEVFFGMDVAAESFYNGEMYVMKDSSLVLDHTELKDFYNKLLKKHEIIYLEDPFYERDHIGWQEFYTEFGSKLMVVADDLVVTNPKFLKLAINEKLANAVIVKPNQVGTLTETFEFIKMARSAKMSIIISHRSGDTAEDTFIADLAVAVEADFMKSGAPARGERVAKYNRLLEIFELVHSR